MNIVSAVSWTDIPTEVQGASGIDARFVTQM
jgi:hypothetical protein